MSCTYQNKYKLYYVPTKININYITYLRRQIQTISCTYQDKYKLYQCTYQDKYKLYHVPTKINANYIMYPPR